MVKQFISFDVKTGMKNIIGRDLITDDFIAIYELVKNSYDAYADRVVLTFEPNRIIISDNGKGMSEVDLREKWFAVAYSAKKEGTEDKNLKRESHLNNLKSRRFYAGAKGVGRFSCDRLGSKLNLITSKINQDTTNKISVEWKEFEQNSKQNFNDIKIPYEKTNTPLNKFPDNESHGTILEITELNSKWNEEKLTSLKKSLEKLINPFSKESNFKIEIVAKEFIKSDKEKSNYNKINGVIRNSILKVLDIKTTQINVIVSKTKITTKLIDRGTLIYHIEEANNVKSLIDDLDISLYFLNRSAKINFGKIMDIEPVNYGNVFLFKNGFRVQPYGSAGDDSWEMDRRKQQGYNRFLGTRDLFGKVDLITENFEEFKEVSSRDGGLVETTGRKTLFELFQDKALKRLERYVAGVLWGEGFKRRNYFINNDVAQELRDQLKDDKDKDTYDDIKSNIGSKLDFVNIIRTLSDDKNLRIISYDKELVNLVNDRLDIIQPKFITELERIAINTNDKNLIKQVKQTEHNVEKLIKEKEEAEKKARLEEQKRIEAEKKAKIEEQKRKEAEKRANQEALRRKEAELQAEKKERARIEAENRRLKAEKKAREEEEKNKALEDKLSIADKKNQYLNATRKTLSEDAEQLVHTIDLYVGNASTYINELLKNINTNNANKDELYSIKKNIDKALKVSQIIIKSNFDYKHTNQRVNLPIYIEEYLEDIGLSRKKLKIKVKNEIKHFSFLNPIDVDIILDNLVSNSLKAKSRNILVEFHKDSKEKHLTMFFYDDGIGVPKKLVNNPMEIFELGVRESTERGSGIGMYDVKERMKNLKGSIEFLGNNLELKGAAFKLTFK